MENPLHSRSVAQGISGSHKPDLFLFLPQVQTVPSSRGKKRGDLQILLCNMILQVLTFKELYFLLLWKVAVKMETKVQLLRNLQYGKLAQESEGLS